MADPVVPDISGYELGQEIGRGGMGVVYAAVRRDDGGPVAIKVLRADLSANETYRQRLRDEADRAGAVRHPGVVAVHEVGETGGTLWLAMERIEGPSLQRYLDEHGALAPELASRVLAQVAQAVGALHEAGIVHRDLKPANILLAGFDRSGGAESVRAKVSDFGIATATRTVEETLGDSSFAVVTGGSEWLRTQDSADPAVPAGTDQPGSGVSAGTVTYMAPEQWTGEPSTARTDIYALGGVLYAALTGLRPYPQRSLTELAMAVAISPAPSPSQHGAPVPFDPVVSTAMAKRPEDRFTGTAEFLAALGAADRREVWTTARPSGPAPARTGRARWIALAGAAVVLLGLAVGWLVWPSSPAEPGQPNSVPVSRIVCADTVDLRDKPGGEGSHTGELHRGETVTLNHRQDAGPWSFVRGQDGRQGWALNEHLRTTCF